MNVADAEGSSHLSMDGVPEKPPGSDLLSNGLPQLSRPLHEKDNIQRRLRTFVDWVGPALPIQLSIAGFVFSGFGDTVECEACEMKIGHLKKEDIPLEIHRKYSPDCSFLSKWFPVQKQPNTTRPRESVPKIGYDSTKAKYPAFVTFVKRLATFDAWPLKLDLHSPTNMSLAGFVYIGSSDRARCFYCGLTLRDWDTDDHPFDAHLQWSPRCAYIIHIHEERRMKGTTSVLQSLGPEEPAAANVSNDVDTKTSPYSDNGVLGKDCFDGSSSSKSPPKPSPQVEAVLAMGFSEDLIQRAIARRLEAEGEDFPDAVSLFCAVEAIAENMN